MAKLEKSGTRDMTYSLRHRQYGSDCPAVDTDCIVRGDCGITDGTLVEYDHAQPLALVETKDSHFLTPEHELPPGTMSHPNARVISRLATLAGLPAVLMVYGPAVEWVRVWSLNAAGYAWMTRAIGSSWSQGLEMTELEWVHCLYTLRSRDIPVEVIDRLQVGHE